MLAESGGGVGAVSQGMSGLVMCDVCFFNHEVRVFPSKCETSGFQPYASTVVLQMHH